MEMGDKMRGKIIEVDGEAKIEIWSCAWRSEYKTPAYGECTICGISFNRTPNNNAIRELIKHFIEKHSVEY